MKQLILLVYVLLFFTTRLWAEVIANPVVYSSDNFPYPTANANLYALGAWKGRIQVAPTHSAETMAQAEMLQDKLQNIGGPYPIAVTTSGFGIKVGTYDEWAPYLSGSGDYLLGNENDFTLISRGGTLRINAKDQISLGHAIWKFLQILGYRQFFPTSNWEIVPSAVNAFNVNIGVLGNRQLFSENLLAGRSSANFSSTRDLIADWLDKNQLNHDLIIDDHQMWQKIVDVYPEFDTHPQYNSDEGNKLCVLEPAVQTMAVDYMKNQVLLHPEKMAHSITAPDGSIGWYEPCENGGPVANGGTGENAMTPSDRQVTLANIVQQAISNEALVDARFEGKHVAMLAYGDTSLAPNIAVNPDVFVTVATAFVKGGQTPDQVAAAYRAMGAQHIGYYGYVGTQLWGSGKPTMAKMSDQTRWVELYNEIMNITSSSPLPWTTGESSSAWGLYGPGFYIFSRLFTDPTASGGSIEALIDHYQAEFVDMSFGPAAGPMDDFIDLITAGDGRQKILSTDLVHKMYDFLQQARALIDPYIDIEIKNRIDDLVIYTRILELQYRAETAQAGTLAELDAYDALAQFVFRTRDSLMYDYYNFFFDPTFNSLKDDMAARYNLVSYTPYSVVNADIWNSDPLSDAEIQDTLNQGLANNPLYPFTRVFYSFEDLAVTSAFDHDIRGRAGEGGQDEFKTLSKDHNWILKTKAGQTAFTITAKAGSGTSHAPHINGPGIIELYETDFTSGNENLIDSFSIVSDNLTEVTHTFSVEEDTLYTMRVIDPSVLVHLKWDKDEYRIVTVPVESGTYHLANNFSYFYVPKANSDIGVYLGRAGSKVYRPDGTVAYESLTDYEYVSVPVTDANDKGQVWKLYCRGTNNGAQGCYLYNVPAQVARSPQELLIQQSLIDLDQL